ncbi:fungal-specific transcription factor domain-containing protein [Penicillium macrosclerotiorum]|uniref:fungal-specific transcription factor domain-containing protein n=1 Tax=Penicillium macrosclerotiorum TaxID=303699 RepID=UPI002548C308|nr:fungal-specific transcription factor domain-containing protein [Penicillium macrosclerotiorum]KAJ5679194.1 fungal-specific transcription factor domain-containing protein [Penicillium macrosclerotiorum]
MKAGQDARRVNWWESHAQDTMLKSNGLPTTGLIDACVVVEQEAMTKTTVNSLGQITANVALDNIELWQESGSGPCLFQGPFGVLDFLQHRTSHNHNTGNDTPRKEVTGENYSGDRENVDDRIAADMNTIADESALPRKSAHNQILEPTPPSTVVSTCDNSFQDSNDLYPPMSLFSVRTLTQQPELSSIDVPPRALDLLRHFKDNILSFSFPLRGNPECPWQTIHFPAAMSTYAELLVSQKASHHRRSLFHSLVSVSCLYRANHPWDTMDCERLRVSSQHLAKQHLDLALEEEITSRKPLKYKELLMAILSMVYLEISSEDYNNAQKLLVEAECLIRRRGFSKSQKSSKVRTLHHMYTWLRIFAESTCGCALVRVCPARPNASLVSDREVTQALRSFRLSNAATLTELDMGVEKTDSVGYQDIHLEVMGTWSNSLFSAMYGVPESLMGLLSQAIRLANEQELLTRDTLVDVEVVTNLNKRTKILEHHILSWDKKQPPLPISPHFTDSEINSATTEAFYYNAFAMHQGLILFYYRRVHNINALILQETVQKALRFIEQACSSNKIEEHNSSLIWPCFIAACEAVDKILQMRLLDWLRDMFHRTAVSTFATAADVVQRVWKAREESSDYTLGWFDVMGHDRCPIIVV